MRKHITGEGINYHINVLCMVLDPLITPYITIEIFFWLHFTIESFSNTIKLIIEMTQVGGNIETQRTNWKMTRG